MIVALNPLRSYVSVEITGGAELPDPPGRLEGTGKKQRHVKIRSSGDVQGPDVRALLVVAARHRGPR